MPLTITTGLQKKIGIANYGSLGASCNVSFEAGHDLIDTDLDAFQNKVKNAFIACRQAVNDQLARELNTPADSNGRTASAARDASNNGSARSNATNGNAQRRTNHRKATASQVRALNAIANRQGFVLAETLQEGYGIGRPEDLSITEASQLIDTLKAAHISYSAA